MFKKFLGFPQAETELEFPKTIEEFGYRFNENGELRNIETNEKFLFNVKPNDWKFNQNHYEALGGVIGDYIEEHLVSVLGLQRQTLPLNDEQPKSRIYFSEDYDKRAVLLLLIQGSGPVRPGQWARQVVINDCLEMGTMFPYIKKAHDLGWGVLIFNPNENHGDVIRDGEVVDRRPIPGSETPLQHSQYVWENFVSTKSNDLLIVAHSFGGVITCALLNENEKEFKSRVKAIALTDSVHSVGGVPKHSTQWFFRNACNWIKSDRPLMAPVKEANRYFGCLCVSAGHTKHEYASGSAIEPVFELLESKLTKEANAPLAIPSLENESEDVKIDAENATAKENGITDVKNNEISDTMETQATPSCAQLNLEEVKPQLVEDTSKHADVESSIAEKETKTLPIEMQLKKTEISQSNFKSGIKESVEEQAQTLKESVEEQAQTQKCDSNPAENILPEENETVTEETKTGKLETVKESDINNNDRSTSTKLDMEITPETEGKEKKEEIVIRDSKVEEDQIDFSIPICLQYNNHNNLAT